MIRPSCECCPVIQCQGNYDRCVTLCQGAKSNKPILIDNGIATGVKSLPMDTKEIKADRAKPKRKKRRRKSLKDRATQATAVAMLSAGDTGVAVADAIGVAESTVSKFRSKKEIKELVDQTAQRLIDVTLEGALNLYTDTIKVSNEMGVTGWVPVPVTDDEGNPVIGEDGKQVTNAFYDKDYHKNLIALRKVAKDVADNVMKSAGLLPTHMIAPRIMETVFAEGRQGLTPALQRLVGQHLQVIMVGEEEDQQETSEGLVDVAPDQPATMPAPSTDSPPEDNPE